MKTLKLFVIALALFLSYSAQAQVAVSVNIGTPPPWGPSGYTEVRYYYLPDVEAYYDVQSSMFIYYGGGVWVHRKYLPSRYRNYDLYGGYKVVMSDYHGEAPYENFREYKTRYAHGYHGEAQRTNRVRPGRGNANARENSHDNGNHNGHYADGPPGRAKKINEVHGKEKGNGHGEKGNGHGENENGHGNGNGKNK